MILSLEDDEPRFDTHGHQRRIELQGFRKRAAVIFGGMDEQERRLHVIDKLQRGTVPELLFRVTDISKTENCPLARVMRKELRRRGVNHHTVVYSPELALSPSDEAGEAPPPGRRSIPGSVSWVPGSAGMLLAGTVIKSLINPK